MSTQLMRSLLALLALLLSTTAMAQQRQPANVSTLPATSPQEFDLLDNQGRWMPFGTASGGMFFDASRAISPVAFGAKCDGVTDDTTALQAWAAATTDRAHLVVPGVCVFKAQIAFPPTAYGVTIEGNGHPGKLLYAGTSTTLDPLIQIGQRSAPAGCAAKGWAIKGLHIMSSTVMTAGDGLRISDACNMQIDDLTIGGNLDGGNSNFFNALHLDGGNSVYVRGFGLQGSNAGLTINGEVDLSHQYTDPMLLHGYVVHSRIGLHICGGVGGLLADDTDALQNGTNVLIDQACAAKSNVQLLFGPHFLSDATDATSFPSEPQIGVHVADPGGPNEIIIYKGWLASSGKQCFAIDNMGAPTSGATPFVSILGATFAGCHGLLTTTSGSAIDNQNTYWTVGVSSTNFYASQGASFPTIYNIAGAPPVSLIGLKVDSIFSISGVWAGCYFNSFSQQVCSDASANNSASMILGGTTNSNGVTIRMDGNGVTTPKKWLRSTNGSFQILNDGGSQILKLTDAGVLQLPVFPTSGGSGGLFVCVDSTGNLYKKATCP